MHKKKNNKETNTFLTTVYLLSEFARHKKRVSISYENSSGKCLNIYNESNEFRFF